MSSNELKLRARVSQLETTVGRVHAIAGRGGQAAEALLDIERECEVVLPVLLDEAIANAGTPHVEFTTDDIEAELHSQETPRSRAARA